jgi:hypothetical protein
MTLRADLGAGSWSMAGPAGRRRGSASGASYASKASARISPGQGVRAQITPNPQRLLTTRQLVAIADSAP